MRCGRLQCHVSFANRIVWCLEWANDCIPASPAVKMEAMLAKKKPIYPRCWL